MWNCEKHFYYTSIRDANESVGRKQMNEKFSQDYASEIYIDDTRNNAQVQNLTLKIDFGIFILANGKIIRGR